MNMLLTATFINLELIKFGNNCIKFLKEKKLTPG